MSLVGGTGQSRSLPRCPGASRTATIPVPTAIPTDTIQARLHRSPAAMAIGPAMPHPTAGARADRRPGEVTAPWVRAPRDEVSVGRERQACRNGHQHTHCQRGCVGSARDHPHPGGRQHRRETDSCLRAAPAGGRPERIADNLAAARLELNETDPADIERAVPRSAVAGERYATPLMAMLDSER